VKSANLLISNTLAYYKRWTIKAHRAQIFDLILKIILESI